MEKELLKEELKLANNNVMTVMENRIMELTFCSRAIANFIINEVLNLEKDLESILKESEGQNE